MSGPREPVTDTLRCLGASLGIDAPVAIPADAFAAPFEELVIVYSVGRATFSDDRRFISVQGGVFQVDEVADGRWSGAWRLEISMEAARAAPPTPDQPFNRAAGQVESTPPNAFSKGRWDFGDGSSITVVGPGFVHTSTTSMLNDVVWLSASQLISTGTGRFEGVQGTKTAAVGLWLPVGQPFGRAREAQMKSLDVFRVIPKEVIGELPPLPPPAARGAGPGPVR